MILCFHPHSHHHPPPGLRVCHPEALTPGASPGVPITSWRLMAPPGTSWHLPNCRLAPCGPHLGLSPVKIHVVTCENPCLPEWIWDVVSPHPQCPASGLAPWGLQAAGALGMTHLGLLWDPSLGRLSTAGNVCGSGSARLAGGCFLLLLWDFQTQTSAFVSGL